MFACRRGEAKRGYCRAVREGLVEDAGQPVDQAEIFDVDFPGAMSGLMARRDLGGKSGFVVVLPVEPDGEAIDRFCREARHHRIPVSVTYL